MKLEADLISRLAQNAPSVLLWVEQRPDIDAETRKNIEQARVKNGK